MQGNENARLDILLVEDSPGDIRLTQEAFREANKAINLYIVVDGVEAMEFLKHEGIYTDSPRPDLILLDLNLPKMDGREVLAYIKDDEFLKSIPTVVLTTSDSETDILASYQMRANCYLCKPIRYEVFGSLVRTIDDFWLKMAKLPLQAQHA